MWRLARAISRRHFTTPSTEHMQFKIFEVLKKFDTCDHSKLTQEVSFQEVGLDSLDTVEAIVALEDILGIELTDEEALKITSVPEALNTFGKYAKSD